MKIGIICFSATGEKTAGRMEMALKRIYGDGCTVSVCSKGKFTTNPVADRLSDWTAARFADAAALIFVGSCGIAVRAIAPFLVSKKEDPAVLVVDELGIHCISLLSGHLGGANALCRRLAAEIGAEAVITTATDLHGKLSPDVFAQKNDCVIDDMAAAKMLAAALLAGEAVKLYCNIPISGVIDGVTCLPLNALQQADPKEYAIVISPYRQAQATLNAAAHRLHLIPRWFFLGIGCRSGKTEAQIAAAVEAALRAQNLDPRCIAGVASIDLKAREAGLLQFCRQNQLPVTFFTDAQLAAVPGNFDESDFVRQVAGVGSVCERSAVALAMQAGVDGEETETAWSAVARIGGKQILDGVTVAIAEKKRRITVE